MKIRDLPYILAVAFAAAVLLAGRPAYGQPTTQPAGPFAPGTPEFICAVDDQPSTILVKDANGRDQRLDNFARWKARGVNVLYRSQKDEPLSQWLDRATAAGFKLIPTVPFLPDGSVDVPAMVAADARTEVIGWTYEDEADRRNAIRPNPPITFPRMKAIRDTVKANATKPIYLTFTGGSGGYENEFYNGTPAGQISHGGPGHIAPDGWFGLPDVVGWDYHLNASGRPFAWFIHDRMQDRAHDWSGGKWQLVYVESGFQDLEKKKRPGPTLAQYKAIVRARIERARAFNHRLKGIIIFPQRIDGGFSFDSTPPDIADAMPAFHASLSLTEAPPVMAPPPATQPTIADLSAKLDALAAQLARGYVVTPAPPATQPSQPAPPSN